MRDYESTDLAGAAHNAEGDYGPTPGCGPRSTGVVRIVGRGAAVVEHLRHPLDCLRTVCAIQLSGYQVSAPHLAAEGVHRCEKCWPSCDSHCSRVVPSERVRKQVPGRDRCNAD